MITVDRGSTSTIDFVWNYYTPDPACNQFLRIILLVVGESQEIRATNNLPCTLHELHVYRLQTKFGARFCHSVHKRVEGSLPVMDSIHPGKAHPPTTQQAGGIHPTGMLSCLNIQWNLFCATTWNCVEKSVSDSWFLYWKDYLSSKW